MTLLTQGVLLSLSVHVSTTTTSTSQESPTLTTVDLGKMRIWTPLLKFQMQINTLQL